jgi:hypothetical protein
MEYMGKINAYVIFIRKPKEPSFGKEAEFFLN